jgi:hypothetical protein
MACSAAVHVTWGENRETGKQENREKGKQGHVLERFCKASGNEIFSIIKQVMNVLLPH